VELIGNDTNLTIAGWGILILVHHLSNLAGVSSVFQIRSSSIQPLKKDYWEVEELPKSAPSKQFEPLFKNRAVSCYGISEPLFRRYKVCKRTAKSNCNMVPTCL
jgi:hypothetical protein